MNTKPIRVAIVGCGLIGKKRAAQMKASGGEVVFACDTNLKAAKDLAAPFSGCQVTENIADIAASPNVDAVMIATTNSALAPLALASIRARKHVLLEKPCGLVASEVADLERAAIENKVSVRAGYNHRYHPALTKAHEIFRSGALGPMMFIRARYGHGGRIGYDKEWRANPKLSGGGELIDQGSHLIDLAGWFLGDFEFVQGRAETYFWDMPVDDNAFIHLKTAGGQTAFLQASCTEWKNLFSFEIYGKNAKLHIEGLGGSYGLEKLHYYKMLPEMGPPETLVYEYPRGDESWKIEMAEFFQDCRTGRTPEPGLKEARKVLEIVGKIYQQSGMRNL